MSLILTFAPVSSDDRGYSKTTVLNLDSLSWTSIQDVCLAPFEFSMLEQTPEIHDSSLMRFSDCVEVLIRDYTRRQFRQTAIQNFTSLEKAFRRDASPERLPRCFLDASTEHLEL